MTEDKIEQSSLKILQSLGFEVLFGPEIGPDGTGGRASYHDIVLRGRLEESLRRLNPQVPDAAIAEAVNKLTSVASPSVLSDNEQFHYLLTRGVELQYRDQNGELKDDLLRVVDWDNPQNNSLVAVNQLAVIEGENKRRPDIVLFVNGLPLVLIELKNATDDKADTRAAYRQIQTYVRELPTLFRFNALCVISDGLDAEVGTFTAPLERFMSWKTITGEREVGNVPMLEVLLRGALAPERLLEIVHDFIVFEREDKGVVKKVAAYHQYWAVKRAVESTLRASSQAQEDFGGASVTGDVLSAVKEAPEERNLPSVARQKTGDHRAGVVWHTQGSGKSLSMLFYAGKLIRHREMQNPTIVVVTDRNDLDDQLFKTFAACQELLRQKPVQADSRAEMRRLLNRESGGVIFTTIQKFSLEGEEDSVPVLTGRSNVVVIADEAHRSQYGLSARVNRDSGELVYGYAKYMRDALPNASYIGFTGTPIERDDRSTPAVFGNYIDIYDVQQAVEDNATVPIYYESRLIDLGMDEETRGWLDDEVEGLLAGEGLDRQGRLKAEWAQKEAIVGNAKRLELIAKDIVGHFESRLEVLDGKGMIVTMSRAIAADLYEKIVTLRPEWHSDRDDEGAIKVVISGSASDSEKLQPHIRSKERLKDLATRMKSAESDLKLVIVCDMWLTGFDAPSLHTMYLDKPLKGHNLMQAIARVNRVYPGKDGGLIVDYLGVARALRDALQTYTESGGKGEAALDQAEAVALMKTKFDVVESMYHGFDYEKYFEVETGEQLQIILDAQEHILSLEDGERRYAQAVLELSKAFALAMPHAEALERREAVAFFQAVKARLQKLSRRQAGPTDEDYRLALKQIVDKAIAPVGVVDVFAAAGLEKPELSILSDEFLAEVREMKRKNLAVEALQKLLNDEIKARFGKNAIKQQKFSEMLADALQRYKNGTIEAAQVVEMLIEMAKDIRDETAENTHGLSDDELAFYDALIQNGSAVEVLGDRQLRDLARLLVERVRGNTSVDWQLRETAKARLRIEVKRLLAEFGYPPDEQEVATQLILEQSKLFAEDWSKVS